MSRLVRESGEWGFESLPDGWRWLPFKEVFENVTSSDRKLPAAEYLDRGPLPVIDQGADRIGGFTDRADLVNPAPPPLVVFGDHTRAVKLIEVPIVQGADGVKVLAIRPGLEPRYAYWALRSLRLPDKGYARHYRYVKHSRFPIPSLGTQRAIVAKIEQLFSELDAGEAALGRAQLNLDRYRASLLKAAVEGNLTEEWRKENPPEETGEELLQRILAERRKRWKEDYLAKYEARGKKPPKNWRAKYKEPEAPDTEGLPDLPEGWCWGAFDQVCDLQLGKMLSRQAREGSENRRRYLRNQNVRWGEIDLTDLKEMAFKPTELQRFAVARGDLLICEGGEPGRCAVYGGGVDGLMYQKALHRARPFLAAIDTRFIQLCLEHQVAHGIGMPRYSETTIKHLTLEKLRAVPIPLPPLAEQRRVVDAALDATARAQRMSADVAYVHRRCSALRRSVLASAFSGSLPMARSDTGPRTDSEQTKSHPNLDT